MHEGACFATGLASGQVRHVVNTWQQQTCIEVRKVRC